MTAVIPAIARRRNAGTAAASPSSGGSGRPFLLGRRTLRMPRSVQRTAHRPSAVSKLTVVVVVSIIDSPNTTRRQSVASGSGGEWLARQDSNLEPPDPE